MKVQKKQSADTSKYPRLPENQPLTVEIAAPTPDKPNPEYHQSTYNNKSTDKVRFRMRVIDGPYAGNPADPENQPPGMVWGDHAMTLGTRKSGEPSKLRMLVQACFARDLSEEEIHDVDLDTLIGKRLIVIGRYDEGDEDRLYLKPYAYARIPGGAAQAPAAPAQAPAAPAANGTADGYTYSPDGTLRWREGMAGWEPVPQAAPPAPPPLPGGPPPLPAAAPAAASTPAGSAPAPSAPAAGDRRLDF